MASTVAPRFGTQVDRDGRWLMGLYTKGEHSILHPAFLDYGEQANRER